MASTLQPLWLLLPPWMRRCRCPWSQRLAPTWEHVAGVVASVPTIGIGKVDCTQRDAVQLCHAAHIAAFPTIALYKGGIAHTHMHYHGDRTAQALLSYLVLAQQDDSVVTDPHAASAGDAHAVAERIARDLHLLPEGDGGAPAAAHAGHNHGAPPQPPAEQPPAERHHDHDHGAPATTRDPADPGRAQALIEAMHAAGFAAPGDSARKARALAAATPTPAPVAAADAAAAAAAAAPPPPPNPFGSGEGCTVAGFIEVQRVPGSFTFRVQPPEGAGSVAIDTANVTHAVHDLFFGPRVTAYQISRLPTGTDDELHAQRRSAYVSAASRVSHAHHVSVVQSAFAFTTGHTVQTYRYTANSHSFVDDRVTALATTGAGAGAATVGNGTTGGGGGVGPSATWSYSLSPMAVVTSETRKPLYHFLTYLCALAGGVITVVGLLDSVVHSSLEVYKRGLGKKA